MKYIRQPLLLFILTLVSVSCTGISGSSLQAPEQVRPARGWDRVFANESGWIGADVASSFLIPGDRVLWVFGDTFIGEVKDGARTNARMVNNSIAVHPYNARHPGVPPSPGEVTFLWGPADEEGNPTAWIEPDNGHAAAGGKTWYWPTGGAAVLPGPGGYGLALFLIRLEKVEGDDTVWGFKCAGGAVAMIDNLEGPAPSWRARVIELPREIGGREIDWGAAALYEPGTSDHVFIYATAVKGNVRDLLLARTSPYELDDFGQWEFWDGDGWSTEGEDLEVIVENVASEMSVDAVARGSGGASYIMVYSEPALGSHIFLRESAAPEGPWSKARPIYKVEEIARDESYFTYAAKAHPSLSSPGELLVSYIVNSNDFVKLAHDSSIYRPRFVSVPLYGP